MSFKLRKCKLVLASASPRRRALLAEMGYRFEVVPADIDETVDPALPPERQAEVLAERKAEAVAPQAGAALVLGADTIVAVATSGSPVDPAAGAVATSGSLVDADRGRAACGHDAVASEMRVIGKAADEAEAREFLRLLTTHRHAVITGLCVLDTTTGERQVAHDATWMRMRPMAEAELDAYIASAGWRDKAGAYALQEGGDQFVEAMEGSESNVVGLPVELVAELVPYTFPEYLDKLHRDTIARHRDLIVTADDCGSPDELAARYDRPDAPLEVEIGPGKDDFVVRAAQAEPGVNFFAIERFRERVDKLCGKIKRAGVPNVRVFFGDARYAIGRLLAPGAVQAFYIHFPDPYPKRRHAKHRLLQPAFVAQLAERLVAGGPLNVVTDVRPYAEQILGTLEATPGLANRVAPGQWLTELPGYHRSVYEIKRRAAGCTIHYLLYTRKPAGEGEASAEPCEAGRRSDTGDENRGHE